jgi:hypothetical protein
MKSILILFVFFFCTNSFANNRSFDRTWLGLFNKKKMANDFSIWTEAQARMDNDRFNNQQLILRAGVLKSLDLKNEVGLIYGHIQTDQLREHRPTFQFSHTFLKTDSSAFSLRNRIEYRKLENQKASSGRYRGLLRFQCGQLIVWDEPFLTFTSEDWTGNRVFERNRFFAGRNLNFQDVNLEFGYLNQFVPRTNRTTTEHILVLYIFY